MTTEAQRRVCRPSFAKKGPVSESVFLQITDETNGRVVTYEKEFKLDGIHPSKREAYIRHLEDSLLYAGWGDFQPKNMMIQPSSNIQATRSGSSRITRPSQRISGKRP